MYVHFATLTSLPLHLSWVYQRWKVLRSFKTLNRQDRHSETMSYAEWTIHCRVEWIVEWRGWGWGKDGSFVVVPTHIDFIYLPFFFLDKIQKGIGRTNVLSIYLLLACQLLLREVEVWVSVSFLRAEKWKHKKYTSVEMEQQNVSASLNILLKGKYFTVENSPYQMNRHSSAKYACWRDAHTLLHGRNLC